MDKKLLLFGWARGSYQQIMSISEDSLMVMDGPTISFDTISKV
jgi:hypothetical protein